MTFTIASQSLEQIVGPVVEQLQALDELLVEYGINGFDEYALWMLVTAALISVSCALIGNFLVLRRMSMMGEAITHGILPGLAIGFMLSNTRSLWIMFTGAVIAGILCTVFTQWIGRFGKVDRGAAMGVVFTTLFALGLILLSKYAHNVELHPDCVLYGALEVAPWNTWLLFGYDIPRAAVTGVIVIAVNVLFILMFYKELKISAFDPALATTLGLSSELMHYILMVLVAVTTVAAFEVVGSILVVAMLIAPPATAYLLTNRLSVMIILSAFIALLTAFFGHVSAINLPEPTVNMLNYLIIHLSDLSVAMFGDEAVVETFKYDETRPLETTISSMISVMAGLLFMLAFIFSPKRGLVFDWWRKNQLSKRMLLEDVLGLLYRLEEHQPGQPHGEQVNVICQSGRILPKTCLRVLKRLMKQGKVHEEARRWQLSEAGREEAAELVRAHRLWEAYLYKHLEMPACQLHKNALKLEHLTSPDMAKRLAEGLDNANS